MTFVYCFCVIVSSIVGLVNSVVILFLLLGIYCCFSSMVGLLGCCGCLGLGYVCCCCWDCVFLLFMVTWICCFDVFVGVGFSAVWCWVPLIGSCALIAVTVMVGL